MRILYQHRTLADGAEGVHINAMVDAFRGLGHEVRVLGVTSDGNRPGQPFAARLKALMPRALFELAAMVLNVPEYLRMTREIRRFRPDLVYKRHARFDVGTLAAVRRARIPAVLEVNCLFSQPPYVQFEPMTFAGVAQSLERRALRQATTVLVVSSPLGRQVKQLAQVEAVVVPNGADTARFDPAAADPGRVRARYDFGNRLVVGWVGVLRDWHGLELLLGAVRQLPGTHLLVVGDGPGRAALEDTARSIGVGDRLTVTGRVPHADMPSFIAAMDVAVVADEQTGVASPMKLLEYMAMARAVVAPAMDNVLDIMTDRTNGLLFLPMDGDAMLSCLRELSEAPSLRSRLGASARETIVRSRTWRQIASQLIDRVVHRGEVERA